ncbi:MAG: hypothetical protein IPK64_16200 [bacterium]|nr:hypothetical protein [bacterium]
MTCCDRLQTVHPIASGWTKSKAVFAIILVIGVAMAGAVDAQNLYCCTANTAAPAGSAPVLYNLPNGGGAALTQARSVSGIVDATITLYLRTDDCVPVVNFTATDMWLEKEVVASTGNFAACLSGTTADANTDAVGVTTWTAPLRAGGWSTSRTLVVVAGAALIASAPLDLRHNSADLNGDGVANLADIPLFAGDYLGPYAFRSDLWFDGAVDLSDIPRLAGGIGAVCQ